MRKCHNMWQRQKSVLLELQDGEESWTVVPSSGWGLQAGMLPITQAQNHKYYKVMCSMTKAKLLGRYIMETLRTRSVLTAQDILLLTHLPNASSLLLQMPHRNNFLYYLTASLYSCIIYSCLHNRLVIQTCHFEKTMRERSAERP